VLHRNILLSKMLKRTRSRSPPAGRVAKHISVTRRRLHCKPLETLSPAQLQLYVNTLEEGDFVENTSDLNLGYRLNGVYVVGVNRRRKQLMHFADFPGEDSLPCTLHKLSPGYHILSLKKDAGSVSYWHDNFCPIKLGTLGKLQKQAMSNDYFTVLEIDGKLYYVTVPGKYAQGSPNSIYYFDLAVFRSKQTLGGFQCSGSFTFECRATLKKCKSMGAYLPERS
jgi:hypothetical protein